MVEIRVDDYDMTDDYGMRNGIRRFSTDFWHVELKRDYLKVMSSKFKKDYDERRVWENHLLHTILTRLRYVGRAKNADVTKLQTEEFLLGVCQRIKDAWGWPSNEPEQQTITEAAKPKRGRPRKTEGEQAAIDQHRKVMEERKKASLPDANHEVD